MTKFLVCPECGRKGVRIKFLPNREDNYYCIFKRFGCHWYAFLDSTDQMDRDAMAALNAANPDAEVLQ